MGLTSKAISTIRKYSNTLRLFKRYKYKYTSVEWNEHEHPQKIRR